MQRKEVQGTKNGEGDKETTCYGEHNTPDKRSQETAIRGANPPAPGLDASIELGKLSDPNSKPCAVDIRRCKQGMQHLHLAHPYHQNFNPLSLTKDVS
jgi:hypothetical protein